MKFRLFGLSAAVVASMCFGSARAATYTLSPSTQSHSHGLYVTAATVPASNTYNVQVPSGKKARIRVRLDTCTGTHIKSLSGIRVVDDKGGYTSYSKSEDLGISRVFMAMAANGQCTVYPVGKADGYLRHFTNELGLPDVEKIPYTDWECNVSYTISVEYVTSYTVEYYANGGSGSMASQTGEGSEAVLRDNGFTRTGYEFLGWALSSSATSPNYAAGARVPISGSILRLYAVWKKMPTTFTVAFYKNDGTSVSKSQKYTVGKSASLPWIGSGLCWSRSGYEFLGWSASSGASSATYGNGAVVNLSASGGSTVRLYAVWKKVVLKSYTVELHRNDGSGTYRSMTGTAGSRFAIPWVGSGLGWSRSGYTFLGWSTSSSAVTATYQNGASENLSSTPGSKVKLYAVWKADVKTFEIIFARNFGEMTTKAFKYNPGASITLPWIGSDLGWTRSGYTFMGWSSSSLSTAKAEYANGQTVKLTVKAGDVIVLWAVWQSGTGVAASTYSVVFHKNDGDPNAIVGPKEETKSQSFPVGKKQALPWISSGLGWMRSGYTFLGWNKTASATDRLWENAEEVKDLASAGGTVHLYAIWRSNSAASTYTVRFHKNDMPLQKAGARDTTKDCQMPVGKSATLSWIGSGLEWSRSGYTFKGWSKDSSAMSATYENGATVFNLASPGCVIDLYAVWSLNVSLARPMMVASVAPAVPTLGYLGGDLEGGSGTFEISIDGLDAYGSTPSLAFALIETAEGVWMEEGVLELTADLFTVTFADGTALVGTIAGDKAASARLVR